MKETPISNCERSFITQAIKQNQRLDGRKNDEFRSVNINFGANWGSVMVALGETKVLAQVSCELGLPKATRPNEGMMYINVELGPMAAPHFDAAGRNSELGVQINRTLERTFKDSRCVDLESLCVTAEERVWILRVDVNVLNHEGNLIDCCSIAALCALAHFKRPDVSIVEDEALIHTAAEKEPIPMVLHHYPVCVSYCTFDEGNIAVADPTAIEERTAESMMVFGLNSYRELCCLNLGGTTLTSSMLLLQCASKAAKHAKTVVDRVKLLLEADEIARADDAQNVSFTECMRLNTITGLAEDRLALKLRHFSFGDVDGVKPEKRSDNEDESDADREEKLDSPSALSNTISANIKWVPDEEDDEDANVVNIDSDNATEDEDDNDQDKGLAEHVEEALQHANQRSNQPISKQKRGSPRPLSKKNLQQSADSSDSEEDEKMVL